MSEDLENKNEGISAEQDNEGGREGYRPSYSNYRPQGRSPRPRIHAQRAYSPRPNNSDSEGGFRPEGFGANLQSDAPQQRGSYQPRGGYNNREGYGQQRGGYQPRQQQGGYRPRYNSNEEGGYQPRQQQGGYRPRYNGNEEGGYQPRQQQGGYRPRYNSNEEGGYQPRQQGYGQQGYQQRGGYGQQRGGYGQQRGGYGQQRSGYGQQRGGYNKRGGYNPNAKYSLKKRIEYKEENFDPNEPVRLNKFLANAGVCSRREADEFIQAGVVSVNGVVVTELGTKVMRTDEIKFHDQPVTLERKFMCSSTSLRTMSPLVTIRSSARLLWTSSRTYALSASILSDVSTVTQRVYFF